MAAGKRQHPRLSPLPLQPGHPQQGCRDLFGRNRPGRELVAGLFTTQLKVLEHGLRPTARQRLAEQARDQQPGIVPASPVAALVQHNAVQLPR